MTSSQPLSTLSHDSLSQDSSLSAPGSVQQVRGGGGDSMLSSCDVTTFDESDFVTSAPFRTGATRPQTLQRLEPETGQATSFNFSS